jgi:hypothetical protein
VPRHAAIQLTRAVLILAGIAWSAAPREARAAGCHRADRPTVGEFEALWAEATAVDPLIEANYVPASQPSRIAPRPCDNTVPGAVAPGDASHPAGLAPILTLVTPPTLPARLVPAGSTAYLPPTAARPTRPPRRPIAD